MFIFYSLLRVKPWKLHTQHPHRIKKHPYLLMVVHSKRNSRIQFHLNFHSPQHDQTPTAHHDFHATSSNPASTWTTGDFHCDVQHSPPNSASTSSYSSMYPVHETMAPCKILMSPDLQPKYRSHTEAMQCKKTYTTYIHYSYPRAPPVPLKTNMFHVANNPPEKFSMPRT